MPYGTFYAKKNKTRKRRTKIIVVGGNSIRDQKVAKEKDKKKPAQKKKKTTLKEIVEIKHNYFQDLDNDNKGGGIFCFMPYDSLDKNNKQRFNVQSSVNINEELNRLKEYYPIGFSMIARILKPDKGKTKNGLFVDYYKEIVEFILLLIKEKGGKSPEVTNNKETGWIYCSMDNIHEAFKIAQGEYGGVFAPFYLVGISTVEHNIIIKENNTNNPQFVGKLVYHT